MNICLRQPTAVWKKYSSERGNCLQTKKLQYIFTLTLLTQFKSSMKKLAVVICLFLSATALKAQQNAPQQAIKINPLSLFLITGNVAYERAVTEDQSFQIGTFYSGMSISGIKYSGFGITPEYRFYFAGRKAAMNGVYAAPFLRFQSFTFKDKETKEKANFSSFGGGGIIGWEKSWDSGFVLDLFVGPSYNAGKFKNESDEDEFDITSGVNGFGIRTGIALGFSF